MINKIVNVLIKNDIIKPSDKDIYNYGLFVILFNFICFITIILLGILFNQLNFTLAFLFFYTPYRIFMGGFHCKSPNKCYFIFNMIFIFILLFNILINVTYHLYVISILLYIIALIFYSLKEKNKINLIILTNFFLIFIVLTLNYEFMKSAYFSSIVLNLILYFIPMLTKQNTYNLDNASSTGSHIL